MYPATAIRHSSPRWSALLLAIHGLTLLVFGVLLLTRAESTTALALKLTVLGILVELFVAMPALVAWMFEPIDEAPTTRSLLGLGLGIVLVGTLNLFVLQSHALSGLETALVGGLLATINLVAASERAALRITRVVVDGSHEILRRTARGSRRTLRAVRDAASVSMDAPIRRARTHRRAG